MFRSVNLATIKVTEEELFRLVYMRIRLSGLALTLLIGNSAHVV